MPINNDKNTRELYLSHNWVFFILIYYLVLFLIGITLSIIAIVPEIILDKTPSILLLAVLGSLGMSLSGSTTFYTRKLYKTCFNVELNESNSEENSLKKIGTIIYFLGRPLFSVGFSLLIIVGLRAGLIVTSKTSLEVDEGFVYLSMFLSFYVGFLSGRFIKNLEINGDKILTKLSGNIKK